ncbi:hypothetical protein HDU91_004773 [Kappamyces sp. JEL0680]|nr:hypothetical protein HDU91_004773 [Kappamyces sp. JEL0680]
MKAILLGPTGMVGAKLLNLLLNDTRFEAVTILTRRPLEMQHQKLKQVVVDFDHLEKEKSHIEGHDVMFNCLGTTRAQAGSADAFVRIDYEYPLRAISMHTGKHMVLLTASGASKDSWLLYPQTKGRMEQSCIERNFDHLSIVRPGLLMLEGQERPQPRFFEGLAISLVSALGIKSGNATISQVAACMVDAVFTNQDKVKYYENNSIAQY